MKIIDAFVFFNEIDLLNVRLHELYQVVDKFVIIEACSTFTGEEKPSIFKQNIAAIEWAIDKIEYVFLDRVSYFGSFQERHNRARFEAFQRNALMLGIERLCLDDQDIVIISDLDEVPRCDIISTLDQRLNNVALVIFEQKLTRYFLNNISNIRSNGENWLGSVALRYKRLKSCLPQGARIGDPFYQRAARLTSLSKPPPPGYGATYEIVPNAGWHFSYLGGVAAFVTKAANMVDGGALKYNLLDAASSTQDRAPRGRHNIRSYRESNADEIRRVITSLAPVLHPCRWPLDEVPFDLPAYLKGAAKEYEHFFFLESPIEEQQIPIIGKS